MRGNISLDLPKRSDSQVNDGEQMKVDGRRAGWLLEVVKVEGEEQVNREITYSQGQSLGKREEDHAGAATMGTFPFPSPQQVSHTHRDGLEPGAL